MKKLDIQIYEGDKPYIFVSYSRRDKDIVYPLIEFLSKEGYRVWYDSGIHPGTEWLDVIAERLDKSSLFLAFLSKNSIESRYCRKEFNFAVANNKDFVGVMLEDVELPPSMKMQMTTVQAIEYYKYDTEDAFKYSLEDSEFLAKCYEGKKEDTSDVIKKETEVDNVDKSAKQTDVNDNKKEKKKLEKKPKKKLKKKTKKILIIIAIIIGLIALGVAAWMFIKNNNPAAKYNPETMYHVTLEPDDEMSVIEFNEAVETLKGRLEVFAGKKAYMIDEKEDKIELYINKDKLMDKELEYVLQCYLTRAMKLYLCNLEDSGWLVGENVSLDRENIENVEIKEGSVEGVDAKEYGIETDTYEYVEITLTDEFAESIADEAKTWGENMVLAQDIDSQPYYYMNIHMMEDGKTMKIFNEDVMGNFLDVFVYNVENAPLSHSFFYEMDINNVIEWENTNKVDKGVNQCNIDELEGHTVTIIYSTYTSELSEGEKLDINKVFKQRLDSLNQPYALGGYIEEDHVKVVVRTGFEHMGLPVMQLLGSQDSLYLQGSFKQEYLSSYSNKISLEKNKDGKYNIILQRDEYDIEDTKKMLNILKEKGLDSVYLTIDNIPYIVAPINENAENGKFVFSNVVFPEVSEITEDNVWMAELLDEVWNGGKLPYAFNVDEYIYDEDENGETGSEKQFGCSISKGLNTVKEKISSVYKDATVKIGQDLKISIFLDLPVDETLPEEALKIVEKMYEESGFEESICTDMSFYFIDEDDINNERARIFFRKNYESYGNGDGSVSVNGIFRGGRLERYKDTFKKLIDSSDFIKEYTHKDYTSWTIGEEDELW